MDPAIGQLDLSAPNAAPGPEPAYRFALARLGQDQLALAQPYLALNRLPYADLSDLAPGVREPERVPYNDLAALVLVDASGRTIAADPAEAAGANLADESYVRAALAT